MRGLSCVTHGKVEYNFRTRYIGWPTPGRKIVSVCVFYVTKINPLKKYEKCFLIYLKYSFCHQDNLPLSSSMF